ncbi:MAG: hypothetical protein BGO49_10390 [Planctomycetales bacterium 71-10]|nr:MAG: hypothetical protein BGO49_10390 [Planctomycetales bacterium 71-10]
MALAWALASALGCGRAGGYVGEQTGPEARRRLPAEVAELIPEDAVLCLDDARPDGSYRIWILRRPGGTWLDVPKARPGGKAATQADSHDMPATALLGVLRSRIPGLDPGEPKEPRCRFTHWKSSDGVEIQVRELITDHGWFASVERVAM